MLCWDSAVNVMHNSSFECKSSVYKTWNMLLYTQNFNDYRSFLDNSMFPLTRPLVLKNKLSVMMYDRAARVLLVATSETVTNESRGGDWKAQSIAPLLP